MSEVQVFTQKGEGKASNEDRAVYGENWMAVFDGATQAEPPADGKDGGWYAEHLSQNVKRILDDQPDLELAQVVHDAIKQLVTDHPLDPDTAPSSTVAIARWREDSVDMYVLGDSFIVWEDEDGERHELTDDRLQQVAVAEREAYRAMKADPSATQDEVRQALAVLQREERKWRNKPGGYWICSLHNGAAFEAILLTTSARNLQIMTDGGYSLSLGLDAKDDVTKIERSDWSQ